ncbi:MAG: FtsK/SpoIIIE domain-containing protein [Planctomycetota bacterium]
MNDRAVAPAGVFDPRRGSRLVDSIGRRREAADARRAELESSHLTEQRREQRDADAARAEETEGCRVLRHQTLQAWDTAEETLFAAYESEWIQTHGQLNRLTAVFRRKRGEEAKAIHRKLDARVQAILQQYENQKLLPGQMERKQLAQIEAALANIRGHLASGQEVTLRRLDRVPAVTVSEESLHSDGKPETIDDVLRDIKTHDNRAEKMLGELQAGAANRFADSFYLPLATLGVVGLWMLATFFLVENNRLLWMVAIIPVAFLAGFGIYAALQMPLKRMTKQLYPQLYETTARAERSAEQGNEIARNLRVAAEAELVARRDSHLNAAERWRGEHLTELAQRLEREENESRQQFESKLQSLDQVFDQRMRAVGDKMRTEANRTAATIQAKLGNLDQSLAAASQRAQQRRHEELQQVRRRLVHGIRGAWTRLSKAEQETSQRFPAWDALVDDDNHPAMMSGAIDHLPIGNVPLACEQGDVPEGVDAVPPQTLPVALHRRVHSALVIRCDPAQRDTAMSLCHAMIWRLLSAVPGGMARLTLIDPLGRGQSFTPFLSMTDDAPEIVGGRVWTSDDAIADKLGEVVEVVEELLQTGLQERFQRVEDYNEVAGSMGQPYRLVAVADAPQGLRRIAMEHIASLIQAGGRCGVITIMVCPDDATWPADAPIPAGDHVLTLRLDADGQARLDMDGWQQRPIELIEGPGDALRPRLAQRIATITRQAARVEVPLSQVIDMEHWGKKQSKHDLVIPIGSQGGDRKLSLTLGHGVAQHVLVAGKTGSGKSSLLHAIITSGAAHYTPDELQFYLLDFKKGVEFKPYADAQLPHASVIGIESEREFGRSTFEALDGELQRRGEAFRDAGVSDVGEYREKTGRKMPRLLLLVDEFQEMFVRDDRLAADATLLLDRLVRQGRSFGMHVVLASQSLAGAYSLPRATLGQMAIRIALQCGASDAAMILNDDNTAARLLSRPGEAIYNDAGGLIEGNQPLQVAYVSASQQHRFLDDITSRDRELAKKLPPAVIFEGNRPCVWTPAMSSGAIAGSGSGLIGLLGQPVEICDPVSLRLTRDSGQNVLLIAPESARPALLATIALTMAKQHADFGCTYLSGVRDDDGRAMDTWFEQAGIPFTTANVRQGPERVQEIADSLAQRDDHSPPHLVIVDPLDRFRDLRQDERLAFSLDPNAAGDAKPSQALQKLLSDGPAVGVHVLLVCQTADTVSKWLPRSSVHELNWKVLGPMNASDSSLLIDAPVASDLSNATLLRYEETRGKTTKFRYCELPAAVQAAEYLGSPPVPLARL